MGRHQTHSSHLGMLSWEQLAVPVLHGSAFWRMRPQFTESRNHLSWKSPSRSTFTQSPPCQQITLLTPISRLLWRAGNTTWLSSMHTDHIPPFQPPFPISQAQTPTETLQAHTMLVLKVHLQTPSLPLLCFSSLLLHFPVLKGHFSNCEHLTKELISLLNNNLSSSLFTIPIICVSTSGFTSTNPTLLLAQLPRSHPQIPPQSPATSWSYTRIHPDHLLSSKLSLRITEYSEGIQEYWKGSTRVVESCPSDVATKKHLVL